MPSQQARDKHRENSKRRTFFSQVNTAKGYVDWQGGYSGGYGTPPDYADCRDEASCRNYADASGCGSTTKPAPHCLSNRGLSPPGNVRVITGRNITFADCTFRNLGGVYAISANFGSQHITIRNCTFTAVSGGAIHVGSTGSRWTTGPLTSPKLTGQNPGLLAIKAQGHVFRGEHDPVATTVEVGSGTDTDPSSTKLVARACAPGKASQLWQLSPGVQPRDSVATLIELAGSNASSSGTTLAPASAAATAAADKMCWRVLACLSTEGATVGCGMGCTPLPPRSPTGPGYECGGHNCACNGGFAFHNDGTIRSLMDGHCVELASTAGAAAARGLGAGSVAGASADQEMFVQMASCSGSATQQFTAKPQSGSSGAFTVSQVPSGGGSSLCVESDFKHGPPPPPPPPPSPPCPMLKNETACAHAPAGKHCLWQNGTCVRPPPPPPPPKPVPQPAVAPEDYDSHFEITENWIHDMPLEYHSAIGIFAGYIADSTIAHNSMERLSYDGACAC